MSKKQIPGLPYVRGMISITSDADLKKVLTKGGPFLAEQMVQFGIGGDLPEDIDREAYFVLVNRAYEAVMAKGWLPQPRKPLVAVGTRVETMSVGGRPGPACKYGVGTVHGYCWGPDEVWRVGVRYDRIIGTWQGYPIKGSQAFPWMIHVIGSEGRPYSSMTPQEIEDLYRERVGR